MRIEALIRVIKKQNTVQWRSVIFLLLFLWGGTFSVVAQNNPFKIKDVLYRLYQEGTKYRTTERGLHIADTLFVEAGKLHDKKAQCLALTIPVFYYMSADRYAPFQQACKQLRIFARENNYLQYYYFSYSQEITYLLNKQRTLYALQVAEIMKNAAFDDNNPYGIFMSFRMAGHIYTARMNYQMALEQYQMALDYARENMTGQSLSSVYLNIAVTYNSLRNPQKALEYVDMAFKIAQTAEQIISVRQTMCMVLYEMGEKEEFNKCYEQCMQDVQRYGIIQEKSLKGLHIKKAILNEKYDEAFHLLDSIPLDTLQYLSLSRVIFEKKGDYKNALYAYREWRGLMDSILNGIQDADMTEMIVQIGAEQLKLKAKSLELNNTKLKLEQATTKSLYEKAEAEKKELLLKNRGLELERVKSEAEKKALLLEEAEEKSRYKVVSLSLTVILLTVIIGFLIFYLRRRQILLKHMAKKNKELQIARDQAEQADRMKTYFIQNMSHEIRTPLNSIVGFSQILSSPDVELEEEQKQEFGQLIQHNSDLLTTLINDVLDLANLESGKYTMKMELCSCNELCEGSISIVQSRKPDHVNLYFTSDVADDYKIRTDGNRVEQVLINFLTNAEKYTEQGEIHLHCSISENPGFVTMSVMDTGPGIPPDKVDIIFERFQKLDEFKQGTGLGLNICQVIAERLNGEVRLDKSYTDGARFLLILPLDGV